MYPHIEIVICFHVQCCLMLIESVPFHDFLVYLHDIVYNTQPFESTVTDYFQNQLVFVQNRASPLRDYRIIRRLRLYYKVVQLCNVEVRHHSNALLIDQTLHLFPHRYPSAFLYHHSYHHHYFRLHLCFPFDQFHSQKFLPSHQIKLIV